MTAAPPSRPAEAAAPAPSRLMRAAVAAAALLVVAGGAAFYWSAQAAKKRAAAPGLTTVTVSARECQPKELTVPAGKAAFKVVNASDRVMEWEILDGVMVVAEKENITPGLSVVLTADLKPGEYQITCGLLSNPHGKLTALSTAAPGEAPPKPKLVAFIGPLAEYRVYAALEGGALVEGAVKLAEAIKAGDLEQARAAFGPARDAYKHVEPLAPYFADLQTAIDARAQYLEKREDDPAFTGFHRIEYGLWAKNSTEGLAAVADRLAADAGTLKARLKALELQPDALAQGASRLLADIADNRAVSSEDAYSHRELADFDANLAGVAKVVELLRPIAATAAPEALARIDAELAAARKALAELKTGEAYPSYDTVGEDRRHSLAERFRALADELGKLNAAIGLA